MRLFKLLLNIPIILLVFTSCKVKNDPRKAGSTLNIVCTTGIIEDALNNIVKNKATITSLMGAGVDPHLYKATHGDLQDLSNANIIVYNGLHLEGKMSEILQKLGKTKPTVAVADGIEHNKLIQLVETGDSHDPHIWFDASLWLEGLKNVTNFISKQDTVNAAFYQSNFKTYEKKITDLHSWVKEEIAAIPQDQRILITAHDAFEYFGRAYGIEVKGLQGISTLSELGLKDISNMVNYITNNKIKAVFVESSVPKKSLEAVVAGCQEKGHHVIIGGLLYSDALGQKGTPEGTYLGMFQFNVRTITKALK